MSATASADEPCAQALPAFSAYGLELEYMIVRSDTLDVLPCADAAFAWAGAARGSGDLVQGALGWSNELARHVVELKNIAPCALGDLPGRLQAEVARLDAVLAQRGARLMPGGMHPWMNPAAETQLWPHEHAAIYQAYDRIFGCRAHGWANVQSTHINLPFAGDDEFARLHAAVRAVVPIIPALAASSPYREGCAPGVLDCRMDAYVGHMDRVPSLAGAVVPETVRSRAEYGRLLAGLYRDIAPFDPGGVLQHEWLNARGAIARFSRHAIEIRVMDVQECPQADVAVVALVVDTVRALYEGRFAPLEALQAAPTDALARVLRACIVDAEDARIDAPEYLALFGVPLRVLSARDLWASIADRVLTGGAAHGALWTDAFAVIQQRGTLARRLLEAAGPRPGREALRGAYFELADSLARGAPYRP